MHTACFVCFIITVNSRSNKKNKIKEEAYHWKPGASSGHITNLKQSILETFDIYAFVTCLCWQQTAADEKVVGMYLSRWQQNCIKIVVAG
jgi:hypothetical protein